MSSFTDRSSNGVPNSQPNILFYSMKCQTCKFFMTQAQNLGILKYFKLMCVDGQERTFQAKGLKIIPTIIVQNNSTPIEGKGCLIWLENIVNTKKSKNIDNPNDQYLPETGIPQNMNNKSILNIPNVPNIPNIPNVPNVPIIPTGGSGGGDGSGLSVNNQQNNSNQFQVPNTNVLRRGVNMVQPPPLPTTNIKGRQVPNPSVRPDQIQLNQIQQSNSNLVQINSNGSINSGNSGPSVKPRSQLFGFLENEMSGCSDTYAYLLVDNALPKSFLPPDKDLQIYTAPEGNKLDKKTQEMYLKNMEMFRDNDKDEFKKTIEKQHHEVLQNNLRK